MSDGKVNVRYEAVANFEAALGRFAQAVLERIELAKTAISKTVLHLEDKRSDLRSEISRLKSFISDADEEEDISWERRRLEEAENEISNVRKWQRRLDESIQKYSREAQKVEELNTETTIEARAYLRGLLNDLSAYLTFQKDIESGLSFGSDTNIASASSGVNNVELAPFDPTSFSLPPDYRWICITEIDTKKELADVQTIEAFNKVSYDEMLRGFHTLREKVLPAMNDVANPAHVDSFANHDALAGLAYEQGLQRVYEAFFGNDPIYLSRGSGIEQFSVTSGRHRIKIAMDAGWLAVPVKASDLNAHE